MDTQAKASNNAHRSSSSPEDSSANFDVDHWEPSPEEKELVKQTWSDDFDFLYELGASIYTYIFEHNPHTKTLFPGIHQHGEQWKDSTEFRSQALKFVQTLSHVVKNVYHMERLQKHLYTIGEKHVNFAARGFKPEYWDIFLDAMEVALAEHIAALANFDEQQRRDATRMWRRLSLFIISHMKLGYFDRMIRVEAGEEEMPSS